MKWKQLYCCKTAFFLATDLFHITAAMYKICVFNPIKPKLCHYSEHSHFHSALTRTVYSFPCICASSPLDML